MKTLNVESIAQWRAWLDKNHASESEVWVVFHKKETGVASIGREDAVDEALGFGWVDSLIKRLDDRRYALKFTPRRPDSRWSDKNRQRYEALKTSGRLKPAGILRPPTDRGYGPRPVRRPLPSKLPEFIGAALNKHPAAFRHFESLSPEQRRRYVAWIMSAKREDTKLRRLKEALRLLREGKQLGLK